MQQIAKFEIKDISTRKTQGAEGALTDTTNLIEKNRTGISRISHNRTANANSEDGKDQYVDENIEKVNNENKQEEEYLEGIGLSSSSKSENAAETFISTVKESEEPKNKENEFKRRRTRSKEKT